MALPAHPHALSRLGPGGAGQVASQIQAVSGPDGEFTQHVAAGKACLLSHAQPLRAHGADLRRAGAGRHSLQGMVRLARPGGTPAPEVARANAALRAALAQKDVIDGVAVMGLEAKSSSAQELATQLKECCDR